MPKVALSRITLTKVSKSYGRTYALKRVTTTLEAGRLIALLGPNGSGKSTMLSILATLIGPDRGEVHFDDRSLSYVVQRSRDMIGYVSHDALLYSDLTGRENLEFYGQMYGVEGLEARIARLLERVDMTEAADKRVGAYSRGMRQRLSIARALLHEPSLLLLDEPFTGLDASGAGLLYTLLREEREAGRIVLLSTHRLGVPLGVVDEVRIVERGRLVMDRALAEDEVLSEVYASALLRRSKRVV